MNKLNDTQKTNFEFPTIEIIKFSCADIITTSGFVDEDQGEWDPQ